MILGLFGSELSESLSPALHRAAAHALGMELRYEIHEVSSAQFAEAVHTFAAAGGRGASITMPHKLAALRGSVQATDRANEIGASNMLTFVDGAWHADNTDGPAFARILARFPAVALENVQVLGSGGAARAAAWACRSIGVKRLTISARDVDAASRLASEFSGAAARLHSVGASTIVSAMPARVAELIEIGTATHVLDLAYRREGDSPLVRRARAQGRIALDGKPALVEQAALAFAFWTGKPVGRVRSVMESAVSFDTEADRA